jgi:hypothetical protein
MDNPEENLLPPLTAGSVALHENMISFVAAGFTRPEALQIVLTLLTETIRAGRMERGG